MRQYLLDSNAVSDLVRNPGGAIAQRIGELGEARVATSVIVASEVRFGAEKKNSAKLTQQVKAVLASMEILAYSPPADVTYGELRAQLERQGRPIGALDLLIAAHALALNLTLVTGNLREFSRVPGLRVENWLRTR